MSALKVERRGGSKMRGGMIRRRKGEGRRLSEMERCAGERKGKGDEREVQKR